MPVYEYKHVKEACPLGNVFEVTQSTHERPLTQCPNWGGRCVSSYREVISAHRKATAN